MPLIPLTSSTCIGPLVGKRYTFLQRYPGNSTAKIQHKQVKQHMVVVGMYVNL